MKFHSVGAVPPSVDINGVLACTYWEEFVKADIVFAQLPDGSLRTVKNRYGAPDVLTSRPVRLLAMRHNRGDNTWTGCELPLNKETR